MTDDSGQKIWLDAGSEEMTQEYYAQEEEFQNAIEEELGSQAQEVAVRFCHLGNDAAHMTGEFVWEGKAYCATWQDGKIISWVEVQPLEIGEEYVFSGKSPAAE